MRRLPKLSCTVESLGYNFYKEGGMGLLFMEPLNCCDMAECIKLFSAIDPDVRRILTYAGGVPDTEYRKDGSGEWVAIDHRPVRMAPNLTFDLGSLTARPPVQGS